METVLSELIESFTGKHDRVYGVVVGKVVSVLDPLGLGRVQVQLPFLDSNDFSPWARVAVLMAGAGTGTYFLPNRDDEVLVAFEQGDLKAPYVIGCLWNATAPPPLPSPVAQIRTLRTQAGNTFEITETPPSITLRTAAGQTVTMSPTGIQITTATSTVSLTADGVTVSGTNVKLVATTALSLTAPSVTINGSATTNLRSGGVCNVSAPLVKIN